MTTPREERVLGEVAEMIREVIAEDWAADLTIRMETSFSKDLELESIEFVALAERIRARYGTGVNLAGWLATMDLERILSLRVGQLVEFIVRCSSESTTS
jgi:acyl carrier protein